VNEKIASMSRYKQLIDIVDYIIECHRAMAKLFNGLGETTESERVKHLLEYLAQQETKLGEALKSYESDAPKHIMSEWMDYDEGMHLLEYIENHDNHKEISYEQVVDLVIELEQKLIQFSLDMMNHVSCDTAKDLFRSIVDNEEMHFHQMVSQTSAFSDL
jgi:rubrerythrin